jgi:predicted ATPase
VLALGEAPNIAARIQGLAEPDTIALSEATYHLVEGYFTCADLGLHTLKGIAKPQRVYRVLGESVTRSRLDIAATRGLTPLVGREQEVGLLLERWVHAKEGQGQVVLLSGEGGIGKSRLVQVLKEYVAHAPHTRLECRSSPYYQHTALYPISDLLQRTLEWHAVETPEQRLAKLERQLRQYRLPVAESLPLVAPLLSLQVPAERYPPLHLSPQRQQDPGLLVEAHRALGPSLLILGELTLAQDYLERGIALYDAMRPHVQSALQDPGVSCRCYTAWSLWLLGSPDQALEKIHQGLTLVQGLSHPYSLTYALFFATEIHQYRREGQAVQERAETTIALSAEKGFTFWLAHSTILRGWALVMQGYHTEGIDQIHQGLAACRATGAGLIQSRSLALLAEAYGRVGQYEEGLGCLAEALMWVGQTAEHYYTDVHRLKGELLLQRSPDHATETEACFHEALSSARNQHAKSWELRTPTSLARLWQSQEKRQDAYDLLAPVYGWFTEGFETADLQDAKALLDALS